MPKFASNRGFLIPRIAIALLLLCTATFLAFFSFAANPAAGSLGPTTAAVTWVGTALGGQGDQSGEAGPETLCIEGRTCDSFTLTLTGTPADWAGKKARVAINWATSAHDYDMYIHKGAVSGAIVASSAQGGTSTEIADIDPNRTGVGTGAFVVHVVYYNVPPVPQPIDQYSGSATPVGVDVVNPVVAGPTPAGTARMFAQLAPPGFGESYGEPSIGSDWRTEKAFSNSLATIPNGGACLMYGGLETEMLRVTWNDCASPATGVWEKKPLVLAATPRALGDPILFTDNVTGRSFVAQEEAAAGATTDVTDDDGDTFMPSQGAGGFSGFDHETIASGPYHAPTPPTATYPATGTKRAVYYAAQNVSDARTSRSDDGGITFLPSIPMYTTADCGGLHGHLKVTPDTPATRANGQVGTVYVPNNACGGTPGNDPLGHSDGQQAAIVSEDNGITWAIRPVPGSDTKSDRDPSIGIATDGTVYMGMQSKDGHARISVTHDQGRTWSAPYDVGAQLGIQNSVFPAVVAGDPNRAAFAFYGTTTPGGNYSQADFPGVWYLYMAVTYDGGASWTTINVTPNDPIQRGGVCGSGTCRNLLDFFDATIDKEGRILIGYDDGCVGACVTGTTNSFTAKAGIARQIGGKRMFAAFDPVEPALPGAPAVTATSDENGVTLTWPTPDDGGSPITEYRIYRGTASGNETFLASTTTTKGTYVDNTAAPGTTYYYRVTAVNAIGEGPFCGEASPIVIPKADPCTLPGVTVLTDPPGDILVATGTTSYPGYDLRSLSLAEPYGLADKIVFTVKVQDLSTVPPSTRWPVQFRYPGDAANTGRWVDMRSDAAGAVTFKYGTFVITNGAYGSPTTVVGDADAGSTYNANGTITIVISRSKIGNPPPASLLQGFLMRVRIEPAGVTPDNMPDSLAPGGSYVVVGNEACRPNLPPVAQLTANPTSGPAPLTVTLDGSGSTDPDAGDTIASYTFSFSDGTPDVTQSSPTIQHTYQNDGTYQARLHVKDSRGVVNENAAYVMIDVGPNASPTPTPSASPTPTASPTATGSPTATPTPTDTPTATPTATVTPTPTTSPTATITPNPPTPTPTASPTATGSPTASPSPTTSPSPSATPSPSPTPSTLVNISSRLRVQTGDNALFAGFIVTGSDPKRIILRAIGPSLKSGDSAVPGRLDDPTLELFDENGGSIEFNDNWRDAPEHGEIEGSGFAPEDERESAISRILNPGAYTAIVRGAGNTTGIAVVEAYDRSPGGDGQLANISTRGFVETSDNVLIGGFIVGNEQGGTRVVVRAIGPSLKPAIQNTLDDPTVEVYNANGDSIATNDNWKDSPDRAEIEKDGLAPTKDPESAVILNVVPAGYTAIVRGKDNTTGVGVVDVYNVPGSTP